MIAAAAMLWIRPTPRQQQIETPAPTPLAPTTVTT
jgi:hypothetical protein